MPTARCSRTPIGRAKTDTIIEDREQELVWADVPEEPLISEPNRVGRTMVWLIYGYMGVTTRCFMPGTMT